MIAAARFDSRHFTQIASWWHTGLLVTLFLGVALSGALAQRQASLQPEMLAQRPQVIALYLSLIAMELALLVAVWSGVFQRTRTKLTELARMAWSSPGNLSGDCGLALGLWLLWTGFRMAWVQLLGPAHAVSVQSLLPQSAAESLLWIAVSASAGFCEELVFRGYFQKQFEILTRRRWLALLLQAALFGVSHGYQGMEACVKIACFGLLFGSLALWRRSLRPGIIAHAWSDIAGGILGI